MFISSFFHKCLFRSCESARELPWKWLHEAQAENAGLRADQVQRWWSPPPAPWREGDEITYAGLGHPSHKDALGNEHTVVVRYGMHQEVLMPKSCETWTADLATEFTWGTTAPALTSLAITLLVHAVGGRRLRQGLRARWALHRRLRSALAGRGATGDQPG